VFESVRRPSIRQIVEATLMETATHQTGGVAAREGLTWSPAGTSTRELPYGRDFL